MPKNTVTTVQLDTVSEVVEANDETTENGATRGRKVLTFEDIVSQTPNELAHAWAQYVSDQFGETVTPRAAHLLTSGTVRKFFYQSELYREAERARQERIDAAKLAAAMDAKRKAEAKEAREAKTIDDTLVSMSPETRAKLLAKLLAM